MTQIIIPVLEVESFSFQGTGGAAAPCLKVITTSGTIFIDLNSTTEAMLRRVVLSNNSARLQVTRDELQERFERLGSLLADVPTRVRGITQMLDQLREVTTTG